MSQRKAAQYKEPKKAPVDPDVEHREAALDEALDESFPASDPVAIMVDPEPGHEPHHGKRTR
jgi:hypothetical protein